MGLFDWLKSNSNKDISAPGEVGREFDGGPSAVMETTISGPYCSGNLAVFLIHGKDLEQSDFITLEEGLAKEKVVVQETGKVNELQINNLGDTAVFVQSGDMVKGGKQDRAFQYDMILEGQIRFHPHRFFLRRAWQMEQARERRRHKVSCLEPLSFAQRFANGSKVQSQPGRTLGLCGQSAVRERSQCPHGFVRGAG